MNPNVKNHIAIATAIAATLMTFAWMTGGRQRPVEAPPAPTVVVTTPEVMTEARVAEERPATEEPVAAPEPNAQDIAIANAPEVNDKDEELNKVRQAARDFVKASYPDTKQDGVFLLALRPSNLYIAGVDTQSGDKRRTVDLLVRRYVKKTGGHYFRAESLDGGQAATLKNAVAQQ